MEHNKNEPEKKKEDLRPSVLLTTSERTNIYKNRDREMSIKKTANNCRLLDETVLFFFTPLDVRYYIILKLADSAYL